MNIEKINNEGLGEDDLYYIDHPFTEKDWEHINKN